MKLPFYYYTLVIVIASFFGLISGNLLTIGRVNFQEGKKGHAVPIIALVLMVVG